MNNVCFAGMYFNMPNSFPQTIIKSVPADDNLNSNLPLSILIANRDEVTDLPLHVEGILPEDITGHIYIIGPAGSADSVPVKGEKSWVLPTLNNGNSIFNGDGMICRLDFHGQALVSATTRLVKTPCFYLDKAVNEATNLPESYKFQSIGLMRLSPQLGIRTQANTACLPIQFSSDSSARLLLTSDTGRPYEIDPVSLEVISPVGSLSNWKEIKMPIADGPLRMIGSAAHPCFDAATDEFFTVNWSKSMESMLAPVGMDLDRLDQLMAELPKFVERKKLKIKLLGWLIQFSPLKDLIYLFYDDLFQEGELSSFFKPYISAQALSAIQAIEAEMSISPLNKIEDIIEIISGIMDNASGLLKKTREMRDFVYLVRWQSGRELESWQVMILDEETSLQPLTLENSLHQIGITKDYIVLMDTSFKVGINQVFGKNFPGWEKFLKALRDRMSHSQATTSAIYIIERADLLQEDKCSDADGRIVAKRVLLPSETAHFAVDYQNEGQKITLHAAHNIAWDPAEWVQPYDEIYNDEAALLAGLPIGTLDLNQLGRYRIDANTGTIEEARLISDPELTWATAIFTHAPLLSDGKINSIYWNSWGIWEEMKTRFSVKLYEHHPARSIAVNDVLNRTEPSSLVCLNTQTMTIDDYYKFPEGCFGNSPQFVPRRNHSHGRDGYITAVVARGTDDAGTGTELWIFDASHLSQGPVCKLSHPDFKLGITIHSTWIAVAESSDGSYSVPIQSDYGDVLAQESQITQALFTEHVFSNFR